MFAAFTRHPDPELKKSALGILANDRNPQSAESVHRLLADADPDVRLTAASVSAFFPKDDRIAEGLAKLLSDEDARIRACAAQGLRGMESRASANALIRVLKDEDRNCRYAAAETLGFWQVPEAKAAILSLLSDPDERVRQSAIASVGHYKDRRLSARIAPLLEDPDPQTRQVALVIFRNLTGQWWQEDLEGIAQARAWWDKHKDDAEFKNEK